jgi:hypothetical protein
MAHHWRRKHDPLTFKYARYPHDHATPADYAKSEEGHEPIDGPNPWYCVATTVAAVAICGVVGLLIFARFAT